MFGSAFSKFSGNAQSVFVSSRVLCSFLNRPLDVLRRKRRRKKRRRRRKEEGENEERKRSKENERKRSKGNERKSKLEIFLF